MAEELVPPTLIGSGIAKQPQPTEPMPRTTLPQPAVGLLQPQPQGDPASLLRTLMAPQPTPNLGLAAASGALQYAPGGPGGANSYLAGHERQMNEDFRRRSEMVGLADRMMQRRREQEEKQEAALMTIVEGFKDSDNPGAQAVRANYLASRAKRYGVDIPPDSFIQSAKLDDTERKLMYQSIVGGSSDAEIAANIPKIQRMPPGFLDAERKKIAHPGVAKMLDIPTPEDLKAAHSEREAKTAKTNLDAWRTENLYVTDADVSDLDAYARRFGRPLTSLDATNPGDAKVIADGLAYAKQQRDLREKQGLPHQRWTVERGFKERELGIKEREAAFNEGVLNLVMGGARQPGAGPGSGLPQLPPGVSLKAGPLTITSPPVSAEATQMVTGALRVAEATDRIAAIQRDPKKRAAVEQYIGPVGARQASVMLNAPGEMLGQVPLEYVDLAQDLATTLNYTIRLITGAQMNQNEETRIRAELPALTDQPRVFWHRFDKAHKTAETLKQRVLDLALKGNRQALDVAQELNLLQGSGPLRKPDAGWSVKERK